MNPAEVAPGTDGNGRENSTQNVWLADGLDRVNLFYGFDDSGTAIQSGRTPDNTVAIYAGMSAANVQYAIESTLTDVVPGGVSVTGAGTQSDPWVVTFTAATLDANSNFLKLAHHYDLQSYIGSLTERDDTRVFERFYRLSDPAATYLFNNGPSALNCLRTVGAGEQQPSAIVGDSVTRNGRRDPLVRQPGCGHYARRFRSGRAGPTAAPWRPLPTCRSVEPARTLIPGSSDSQMRGWMATAISCDCKWA